MSRWLRVRGPLDRIVGFVGALVCAPVVALLGLLVRRADGGPGLVALPRVGSDGRVFAMRKLRTMRAEEADGAARGSRITAGNDDRVTPIGRRLRSLHLDELPQLWNVARGEMLLLGPRPETPELVDPDDARWRRVLTVAPGLAGPTQLVLDEFEQSQLTGPDPQRDYRDRVLPLKLAVDQWYVAHATPWVDALVVVSFVQRVVLGRPSCAVARLVHRAVPETARSERGQPLAAALRPTEMSA